MSKNNDDHNVDFFALVRVVIAVADKSGTCPLGCPSRSTPLRRRRGGNPTSSKPQSNEDDEDDNASIASISKNNNDQVQLLPGFQTTLESLAQPGAVARQEAALWTTGQEAEAEARQGNNQPVQTKWGGKGG
jgi:hypothetical protein